MVHRVVWRVASSDTLGFWERRLGGEGVEARPDDGALVFSDPEGLEHELVVTQGPGEPVIAHAREVPDEYALQGFDTVRAFTADPERSRPLLEDALAFERRREGEWEARGAERGGRIAYDRTERDGRQGAGSVHHVAWATH